jgi:Co/Zn/Cd efflux system component
MTEYLAQVNASINGDGHHEGDGHNHDNEHGGSGKKCAHGHDHNHSHDHAHTHKEGHDHPHKHGDDHGHSHGDKHDHNHDHDEEEDSTNNKDALKSLYIATFVSIFFIGAQLAGGILANSIAIMLDTAHLATDVLGFGIAIMAIKLGQKKAEKSMSFGYHRAEVMGTLLSVFFLWGITIWLLFAAYGRLLKPPPI